MNSLLSLIFFFFFFNDTATTEIYTLSLHDALRSLAGRVVAAAGAEAQRHRDHGLLVMLDDDELQAVRERRSEEHTSELQSLAYLVCRLLLEKKKRTMVEHLQHSTLNPLQRERRHA